MGDVIDIMTRKRLDSASLVSRLETSLESAIADENRAEIGRLAQLLHSTHKSHPIALAGLAIHNLYLGNYKEAAICADAAVHYGNAGKIPVIAKLNVIYHGCDKGAYEHEEAREFMHSILAQYQDDIEVLEVLFNIAVEVFSHKEFAERVLVEAIKADKTHFKHYRGRVDGMSQTLVLYSEITPDSEQ